MAKATTIVPLMLRVPRELRERIRAAAGHRGINYEATRVLEQAFPPATAPRRKRARS